MPYPEIATFREFARIAGFKPGYITQLRKDDRLVLTPDGKHVRVQESIERIEATKDPTRIGVVKRHAAERAAKGAAAPSAPGAEPAAGNETEGDDEPEGDKQSGYQYWRERGERAKALSAERENDVAEGKLMIAADVEQHIAAAATVLRTKLESLPDALAPELAAMSDESKVRATLASRIGEALNEISRQFAAAAKAT
jgi:hypothetical protein